LRDN